MKFEKCEDVQKLVQEITFRENKKIEFIKIKERRGKIKNNFLLSKNLN